MAIEDPTTAPMPADVRAAYDRFAAPVRDRLLEIRRLIFRTAADTEGVGPLTETLKWGEPAYLTAESGSGSTIRLGQPKASPGDCAVFFNCNTGLVDGFRAQFPDAFRYQKNRAIVLDASGPLPEAALEICLAMALTYHSQRKRRQR